MRIAAENDNEYKQLLLVQNLLTQQFKAEKENDPDGPLTLALKKFINTPVDKTWQQPGTAVQAANAAEMDTEEQAFIVPYLVHAALHRKKVAIEYLSANKPVSKRIIEPMNWAKSKSGGVNVISWCHDAGAWRHFNPANIARIAVLDEDFDRPEEVTITAEDAKEIAALAFPQ